MRPIKPNDPMRHYKHLVAMSEALGMPTSFQTDLTVHDRDALVSREVHACFAWIVYQHGTGLVFPGQNAKRGQQDASYILRCYAETFAHDGAKVFWWDGDKLAEVSVDDAVERMRDAEQAAKGRAS